MVANAEKRSRDRYAASALEIGLKLRRASRCYAGGAYRLPIRWTRNTAPLCRGLAQNKDMRSQPG